MPNKLIIKRLRRLLGSYGSYVEKALGVFSFCVEPGEQWAFSGLFYRLEVLEDGFSVMAEYPLTVPEERLGMAVEFLNAIGGQEKYGRFCLEMDTGKISYLLDCDCTACLPGEACLMDCIDQVADGLTRWDGPIRQLLDGARFLPEPLEEYTPGCVDASDYPGDGTFRDRFDQGRYRWVARLEAFYQAHPGWKKARTVFFLAGILLAALYCGAESVYCWLLLANSCWGNLYFAVNALEQVLPPILWPWGVIPVVWGIWGIRHEKEAAPPELLRYACLSISAALAFAATWIYQSVKILYLVFAQLYFLGIFYCLLAMAEIAFENTRAEFWKHFFTGTFWVLAALATAVLPEIRL